MTQRTVIGPFNARNLGPGVWQLTAGAPSGAEIYLQGASPEAFHAMQGESIASLGIEWHAGAVRVALTRAKAVRLLTIASAIIHEPKARLYESLPLASFDAAAQQFWGRVFRLMRIPGGRFLLRFIARRNRAKSNTAST